MAQSIPDIHFYLLRQLARQPRTSQRALAKQLNTSLGRINDYLNARLTARFLQRKRAEYEALRAEIEQPTAEVEAEGLSDR